MNAIVKDTDFHLVSDYVKPDGKKRISLSCALDKTISGAFNVYSNAAGQIILDPVVAIPASEAWLFKNKKALASVRKGISQAARGEVHDLGSFAKYADEED